MAKNGSKLHDKSITERTTKLYDVLLLVLMIFYLQLPCECSELEIELLQSMKASMKDPFGALHDWIPSRSFCHWNGVVCDESSHVSMIELSGKNLSGKVSETIFDFPYVQSMDLSNNQLSGEIPINLSSCLALRFLNLSNNNFTGSLPQGSRIPSLETLDLSNNMLSGKIPESIGLFSRLKVLDFGGNVLVGNIPKTITNISGLEFLTLASNQLTGEIPQELGLMKSLKLIYLGYNNFSGGIPKEIGELTSLYHLDLVFNNLTGEIPSSLGNLTNLQYLFLYLNKLTGPIPRTLINLKKLVSLDLSDNYLSGEIPQLISQLQNLEVLQLFSNNFNGNIPSSLTSLPKLQVLQLWSNKLSGDIPKDLGKRNNLTVLDLSTNNLTGKIPETLCDSGHLYKLILFSNSLQGEIPVSLSNCKSLQRVRLQNNRLTGELSPELTKLPLVYFLDISGNNLFGSISERKWDMPALQMLNLARNKFFGALPDSFGNKNLENLDLSENGFSGVVPRSFGTLSELVELKLSTNKLAGEIPYELSSCKKLVSLDLSHNQLSGQIPISLSQMPVLGLLDLSMNQLSGEIPPNLGKIESLVQVNISHNHFRGILPPTGAFLAINSSAVAGNQLCSGGKGDETTGLPPCNAVKSRVWWFFLTFLLGILVLLVFTALVFVFIRKTRDHLELKRVDNNQDGIWEIQFFDSKVPKSITIQDILSSTIEENLISRTRKGVSYKGYSQISNMQIFVKILNLNLNLNLNIRPSFWTIVQELGNVRHPNVVKLLAACKSEKGGILVYEYVEGKELSEAIRGMSWERRQKVAIGIARALKYLHCSCSPSIVVGDVSRRKVMIDCRDEARLRLSLPEMAFAGSKGFASRAYLTPEIAESKGISEKSDIYGFGLLLIELLTGKNPGDPEVGASEGIVEWARYCYSDCHLEMWIDTVMKSDVLNNQKKMVEMMNLALQCTASEPAARPCASDVAKTLDSFVRSSSCGLGMKRFSSV